MDGMVVICHRPSKSTFSAIKEKEVWDRDGQRDFVYLFLFVCFIDGVVAFIHC